MMMMLINDYDKDIRRRTMMSAEVHIYYMEVLRCRVQRRCRVRRCRGQRRCRGAGCCRCICTR